MKALTGRRAGRRQPSKIEPILAAGDAAPIEPDDPASAEALAARDRTGWPLHPSERRDFYHRIRVFPPEMAGRRKRMVRQFAADPDHFPCEGTPLAPREDADIQAR